MRPMMPTVQVPGDNEQEIGLPDSAYGNVRPRIMARSGQIRGYDRQRAVWYFGFASGSEAARAYGVRLPENDSAPMFVLATLRTGKVLEIFRGPAIDLPPTFTRVLEANV